MSATKGNVTKNDAFYLLNAFYNFFVSVPFAPQNGFYFIFSKQRLVSSPR